MTHAVANKKKNAYINYTVRPPQLNYSMNLPHEVNYIHVLLSH